jgi:hypothetical protein
MKHVFVENTYYAGLRLRRQFLLAPQTAQPFLGWHSCKTRRSYIHHHTDLPVTQCRKNEAVVTMIGYAIDPNDPLATDQRIVERLAESATELESVIGATAQMAGRWVLLVEHDDFDILLHDACGLRQVFYSDHTNRAAFCASQAATAAKVYDVSEDPEATEGFLKTRFALTNPEFWWPGDSTQFCGVRCLLPNHYLDLRTRQAHRYGLGKKVRRKSLSHAAKHGAELLASLIRGVAQRYPLALPITAGWDSRALLAACRHVGASPYCYTLRMGALSVTHQDVAIPARLLGSLQWDHHIMDCQPPAPSDFMTLYKGNADPAHDEACSIAYGLSRAYPEGFISLSGHCSEVARCYYRASLSTEPITPETLAKITQMDGTPFVLAQFRRWLEGAAPTAKQSGISLLDLFYWEQRAGRWAANGQAQWDLVHERFTAFNYRPLLLTLLSAHERHRRPAYPLYRRMIEGLAPEVLREPINPDAEPKVWKRSIPKAILRRLKAALRV